MKKIIISVLTLFIFNLSRAQTNTFPSSGNIGIGTTSPSELLHLKATAPIVRLEMDQNSQYSYMEWFETSTRYAAIGWKANDSNRRLTFLTKGSSSLQESMVILGDGNVGIGTTSPDQKLHIEGSIKVSSGTFFSEANSIIFRNQGGAWRPISAKGINIGDFSNTPTYGEILTGSDNDMKFKIQGATRLFIDKDDGNIGIGTTSPDHKLEVSSPTLNLIKSKATGTNSIAGFAMNNDQQEWIVRTSSDDSFQIRDVNNNAQRLVIDPSNGNIGIGTTTPAQKLDVEGSIKVSSGTFYSEANSIIFRNQGGAWRPVSSKGINIGDFSNTPGYGELVTGSAYDMKFKIQGATRLFIDKDDGNIGIGTTSPSEKLEVDGNALFQGYIESMKIRVTANPGQWPDYVFEPGYQPLSLDEIETYIKANKHLPEVPSAQEVAEKGQDLGEIQTVLLKKLEEMTLQMIEMNKKQEALIKEVEVLKQENKTLKEKR